LTLNYYFILMCILFSILKIFGLLQSSLFFYFYNLCLGFIAFIFFFFFLYYDPFV
jgi:hypothetical protein